MSLWKRSREFIYWGRLLSLTQGLQHINCLMWYRYVCIISWFIRFPWVIDYPESRRDRSMYQRAGWPKCSKKGNNSRISQQQHDAVLIREWEWIEASQFQRMRKTWMESVRGWVRYVRNDTFQSWSGMRRIRSLMSCKHPSPTLS